MADTCRECGHLADDHIQEAGVVKCTHKNCGCEWRPTTRRLTRQERLQELTDQGVDTWEEYRGER